jgi:sulfate permease, SulP family
LIELNPAPQVAALFRGIKARIRSLFSKRTLRDDAMAGMVLGIESVPDGLAGGLLAGVNPVYGLHAYMVGTLAGGLTTSSAFMAVQATGAMAIVVADVAAVHRAEDPARALFTLSVLTGLAMLAAGLFKLGSLLRFVSNAVMVGFINAVGVNIVLGQLENFTGYAADGANRVSRALDTLFHMGQVSLPTILVGGATIGLIVVLEKTRLGPLGLVVAVAVTSSVALIFSWDVLRLEDIADIPNRLPAPIAPLFSAIPDLIVPALSLAFVGLVQGAGISANVPNPDGRYPDPSEDFSGQGIANLAVGIWQGMPVGGSMSATALVRTAGAKSRTANVIAAVVMALAILFLTPLVENIAMPALAGLLMVIGYRTIKPANIRAIIKTGRTQTAVMTVTFVLTMLIPLQNAVMVGVGISVILYVIAQSNRMVLKRWERDDEGNIAEVDPPGVVGSDEVIVLQPYGSLFFASAKTFEQALPDVTAATSNSVVIVRFRGMADVGSTLMEVLLRYASFLKTTHSKLVIISADETMLRQLAATGVTRVVGDENIYTSDKWLGRTVTRAWEDAESWVRRDEADAEI